MTNNRQAMPEIASVVDAVRTMDPTAKVKYAQENGITKGNKGKGTKVSIKRLMRYLEGE